ncbi:DEKNAAC105281 [Brettanomyces naardenensis]|uniref:DEKNAAC105281 n=1 Tax=Brettanomyces naardenensis TaxID=13370 RepID=A0A448YSQ5_BRENA|nr:DEKNAAC105281 [Brettanomyces naardenensis]
MEDKQPVRVAFVCLGNICRSPMAQAVFSKVVKDRGHTKVISKIDSFGTAAYHTGETPDYRTVAVCKQHEVPINHRAQKIAPAHFQEFDYIICMDEANLHTLRSRQPRGSKAVVRMFGHWRQDKSFPEVVEDPYYGGVDGFEACYKQCVHFSQEFIKREIEN